MNRDGFTLIEVMISIILLSFMTLAVINNTSESFELKDRTVNEDSDRLRVYTALSIMEYDFTHIYSPLYFSKKFDMEQLAVEIKDRKDPLYELREEIKFNIDETYRDNSLFYMPNEDGIPIPRFKQPEKSTFEFFTNSNRRIIENSKESVYSWIIYTLEAPSEDDVQYLKDKLKDPNLDPGSVLVRYHISKNPFSDEDLDFEEEKSQVIMELVDEVEFTFWDSDTQKFSELKQIVDGQGWITAIKVLIKYRNIYNQPQKLERIFRPIWPLYNPLEDEFDKKSKSQLQQTGPRGGN